MNILTRLTLVLAAVAFAIPALAAERGGPFPEPQRSHTAEQGARITLAHSAAAAKAARGETDPKSLQANYWRTYPASCLADPLPENATGPVYSETVTLAARNTSDTTQYYAEDVTIRIWRVACSSSGEFYNSATLMRIDRQAQYEGDNAYYPLFPHVSVDQVNDANDIPFDDPDLRDYVRVAEEPNTVISDVDIYKPIVFSQTYVLENFPGAACNGPCFDFNYPFTIRFDNFLGSAEESQYFIDVPVYNPTPSTYPDAFASLPINGYLSSNWYQPGKGGEGIVVQVYERQPSNPDSSCLDVGGGTILPFSFTWFTYDPLGLPFFLFGDGCVPAADPTRITVETYYNTGLGFAGNFNQDDRVLNPWGQVTFEFPTCNTMWVDYQSDSGLPEGIPAGSGQLDYSRIANVNGLTCE